MRQTLLSSRAVLLLAASATASSVLPRQSNDSSPTPGAPASEYLTVVSEYVDSIAEELWPISQEIHDNPELGYEEVRAHELLTTYMEGKEGWSVERTVANLSTAFVAVFDGGFGDGPVVSFNAEYDALVNIGHGCGHNLIATASVAGALGAAEVMRTQQLPGKVILFGTPAEESLGGKVRMLEAGAFADYEIDISIMAHPNNGGDEGDTAYSLTTATDRFDIEYVGTPAHAAASPWQGVNAQDAMSLAYTAIGLMRQQIRPTDRVHGRMSTESGAVNIIPDVATAAFQLRSSDNEQLADLIARFEGAMEAGAMGTGAQLNLTMRPYGYSAMLNNDALTARYKAWFDSLADHSLPTQQEEKSGDPSGSTDQGNVSHEFPALHAFFGIFEEDGSATTHALHTEGFRGAAATRLSFDKALLVAKSLAGTAVDVLTVEGLLDDVRAEFEGAAGREEAKKLRKLRRRFVK